MIREIIVLGAIVFAIAGCLREQTAVNYGLPLVDAAQPASEGKANMLFTPCPLGPQNVPPFNEVEDI